MIDEPTRARFEAVRAAAREQGLDLAESLDRAQLLRTPARTAVERLQGAHRLLAALETVRPFELLERARRNKIGSSTPDDMYEAIVDFLEEVKGGIGVER